MKSIFSSRYPGRRLIIWLWIITVGVGCASICPRALRTVEAQSGGPIPLSLSPRRIEVRDSGQLRFTVVAGLTMIEALPDDTLRARLLLTLPRDEQLRLARLRRENGAISLSETVLGQEVRLRWRRGTSCPDLDLELPALKFGYLETVMTTRPALLRIDVAADTVQTLPQLLCNWTRQINAGRPRLGIILAINRLLTPLEP